MTTAAHIRVTNRLAWRRGVRLLVPMLLAPALVEAAPPGAAPAIDPSDPRGPPAIIDARQLRFEQERRQAYGEGDVVIRYQDAVLRADRVRFDTVTQEAWADGNVRLNRRGQEWVAPALQYNFATGHLETSEVRGWIEPVIISGYDIRSTASNRYDAARATLTTCDYARPHFRLEATHSTIWPGDRIVLYNAILKFGDVPVFWLPVLVWSLRTDAQPVVLNVGNSSRWGYYGLLSSQWQLTPWADLTLHVDGRTERGVAAGVDFGYRLGPAGRGAVRTYYADDRNPEERADVLAGKNLPAERYRVQWQHLQALRADLDLRVDLNKLSDEDVIDDFFSGEFRREREPQTAAELTLRGDQFTVAVVGRPQLNSFFAEVERLPEMIWSLNRSRLGDSPLFYEAVGRVGYLNNEPGDTGDPLFRGHAWRAFTFHQLVLPLRWFGWWSVVPRAGMGGTLYTRAPATSLDGEQVHRAIHHVGLESSFKLSRTWPGARSPWWQVDGLRHIIQPFANYHWIPPPDNGTNEVFQFDTVRTTTLDGGDLLSLTRWSPLELPTFDTIDAIDRLHVVRFGLRQKLQTRHDERPWDLVDLEGWTDHRIEHEPAEDDFSDLYATLRVRPFEWVALESFGRYDMGEGVVREYNAALRVAHRDRWSLGVGTRWLREDSNLIAFSSAWRLTRHWVAQTYHRVDLEDGVWESQEYLLRQETHDWLITYGVRIRSERIRPDEYSVFVGVSLKAFPGLGLSMNRVDFGATD
ncbi:LPS-assembly protein LptD [bacterium]|nr:LPS-assembly protein LptD [bacterium]